MQVYPTIPHVTKFPLSIPGDEFVIIQAMEKGSVISFGIQDHQIYVYHLHRELSDQRDLDGVYEFLIKHLTPLKHKIHETMIYFGIWTSNKRFLLMDMYNTVDHQFHSFFVKQFGRQLKLQTIDVLYQGKLPESDVLKKLSSSSDYGICVKTLNSFASSGQLQYVLIAANQLSAVPPETIDVTPEHIWIQEHVTSSVIIRIIHEMIQEKIIPMTCTEDDLREAMKNGMASRIKMFFTKELEKNQFDEKIINRVLGKRIPRLLGEWFKEQK